MTDAINYGKALYELAEEENLTSPIKDELCEISKIVSDNPELISLLDSPGIELSERQKIVSDCFNGAHEYTRNFIHILTGNRSMHSFAECVRIYNDQYDKAHGIVYVTAVTAIPMTNAEKEKLSDSLKKKYGSGIVLKNSVDPSILGGMVLQFPDFQTDASLKKRLDEVSDDLKSITLQENSYGY